MYSDITSYDDIVQDDFYVSNQGKLYKNTQYVTIINKHLLMWQLINMANLCKLVCVYATLPHLLRQNPGTFREGTHKTP